ncbi:MAG: hypothetical protein GWN40_00045, partial [Nitrosopumilaceae archaeon]|nr:hypothetical protein [Nitrosopumilaceae archaeon]
MMAQKAEFNEGEVKDNGKGTDDAEIFTITSDETSFDRQSILAKLDKKQLAFSADALVRKSSSSPQESSDPFENIPLARFNKAGNNLKLNMWSKFGGNLFNYLVPLVGITTEETTTTVTTTDVFGNPITVETGTEEETKVSTLGYIFSFGSIGAFIFSDYKAGQAGSDLHAIG